MIERPASTSVIAQLPHTNKNYITNQLIIENQKAGHNKQPAYHHPAHSWNYFSTVCRSR